jgi:aryl-alcohol dehydrogenase-like predicted oxidoreductase
MRVLPAFQTPLSDTSKPLSYTQPTSPDTTDPMPLQSILQAGLSLGQSATAGFHKSTPPPMPDGYDHEGDLTPSTFTPSAQEKVTYRGKYHNVKASRLVVGAWPWGDEATFHWDDSELPNVQEAWKVLLANGVNHIDTAQVYGSGKSERICGQLVKGLARDEFVMQTKFWVVPDSPKIVTDWSDAPLTTLKGSLERTGLESMDVYMVHGPIHPQSIATIAKSLADCVDQRLTKTVAVANYSNEELLTMQSELAKYGVPLACAQCEYHVMRREPEVAGLLAACKANDIVFQSYSSLAQGRLSGKYTAEDKGPPSSYKFSSYPMKYYGPVLDVLNEIAKARNVPVAAVSLNYNMVHGVAPLVGMRNAEHARSNVSAFGWRLSDGEIERLDAVSSRGKTTKLWQQG